jgi:hypothetical protein
VHVVHEAGEHLDGVGGHKEGEEHRAIGETDLPVVSRYFVPLEYLAQTPLPKGLLMPVKFR